MPPRGGEGQPKQRAKPKAVDTKKTEHPIDLGIGKATASLQKAAKQIKKSPVAQPNLTTQQRQTLLQAKNPSLARAAQVATQTKTKQIIRTQKPNILNADIFGLAQIPHNVAQNSKNLYNDALHPGRLISSGPTPVFDPKKPLPVNAGIAFPGGPGKVIGKLGDLLGRGGKVAEEAAPVAESNPIAEAIPGLKNAQKEQAASYKAERSQRAAKAEADMAAAEGMDKGKAFLGAMKGEYKKVDFTDLTGLTPEKMDEYANQIHDHPGLDVWQKGRAISALDKVRNGEALQASEIDLIEKVFGPEAAKQLVGAHGLMAHAGRLGVEVMNIPRSVMASFDLSAPLRQGLILGARHPIIWGKNFAPMVRAFKSEDFSKQVMDEIAHSPRVDEAMKSGLDLTDFEHVLSPGKSEEQFMYSNLAEKLTGKTKSPIRMSGRAYTTFLNKFRFDVWNHYMDALEKNSSELRHDPKALKQIARFVNSATGRGKTWKGFEEATTAMNSIFFSPRLLYSRLNFLSPLSDLSVTSPRFWLRQNRFVKTQVARSMLQLAGTASLTLYLLHLAGAKVGLNPLSADFGKAKFGNTRVDVLGGLQQPIRLAAQEYKGKMISSTTGREMTLSGGFGSSSRRDVAQRFVEAKLAPVPSVLNDAWKGKDFSGKPFNLKNEAVSHLTPLLAQDAADVQNQTSNPALTAATYGVGAFGVGFQTYGPKDVLGAQHKKNEEKTQAWLHGANALLGQAAKAGGQTYHGLPAVIVRAAGVKLKYEDALAQLKAKNPSIWAPHSSKMSDAEKERRSEVQNRQTAAVLAHLLIDSHPGFTGGDQLLQTIHDAPPSELSGIASRIKEGLGLDVIDRLDRGINEQRHRQADQHFIQTH